VLSHHYGGSPQQPLSDVTTPVVDPATGRAYDTAPVAGASDLDAAFAAAQAASTTWRRTTPAVRSRALLRLADLLEERAEEFVDAECRNTGKPRPAMRAEMPHVIDVIRFSAGASRVPRASPRGSTPRGTPPWSAVSRSGSSRRSRPGTTR
jgi:betaine-aldehyde dehydrogenase